MWAGVVAVTDGCQYAWLALCVRAVAGSVTVVKARVLMLVWVPELFGLCLRRRTVGTRRVRSQRS